MEPREKIETATKAMNELAQILERKPKSREICGVCKEYVSEGQKMHHPKYCLGE